MADISIIKVNNVDYNIKDAVARAAIGDGGNIPAALNGKVGHADYRTVTESGVPKHYIYFYKDAESAPDSGVTPTSSHYLFRVDAADFVKDGMVNDVAISNGNLVVTWNSDSGISPTSIPLTDIFNPANYYDKTTADGKFLTNVSFDTTNGKLQKTLNGTTSDVVALDSTPTSGSKKPVTSGGVYTAIDGKANKSEMSVTAGTGDNADKTTIQLKSGTSATVLTEHQDITGKQDKPRGLIGFLSDNFGIDAMFGEGSFPETEETARQLTAAEESAMSTIHNELGNHTETWENEIIGFPLMLDGADPYSWYGILYNQGAIGVISYEFHKTNDFKYWFTVSMSTIATSEGLAAVATSGSYNDLTDTPTIPDELADLTADSTHRVVTDAQISAWNAKYDKPNGGIPATDLASAVQTSLGKADSAIQGVKVNGTELTPDSNKKVDVTVPTALADLTADSTHRLVTDTEKATWNAKQAALTFDNVPTQSSNNPVKSGGVYSALADIYDGYNSSTETISFTFPVVS